LGHIDLFAAARRRKSLFINKTRWPPVSFARLDLT
jgi:hypothetical protein